MEDKIAILDRLFNGLKFKNATYSEKANICYINFLYNPEFFKLNDENISQVKKALIETIGDYVSLEPVFIKCPLDKRTIANHIYMTIINNFPSLSKDFTYDDVSVEIENVNVKVELKLVPSCYLHAMEHNRQQLLQDKLKDSFLADFTIDFKQKEVLEQTNNIENNMELMQSIKQSEDKIVYTLSNIVDIIGKIDGKIAIDYSKVNSVVENVLICGEVISCQRKTYKRNYKKNNETKEIERAFYNFSIKNEGKILYCSIFPKQNDETKADLIETGMKVCCYGSFREYNNKFNFTANNIARCDYSKEDIKSNFKEVNQNYHTVFPKKYVDLEQADLFNLEEKSFPGTYVVFDLETTGLDANKEEIIEIGACKIVNGRIDEVFSTFVKPNKVIPKEITELTGITNQMVADAPNINYVMPDFYKFCYGATMVAHNVSFDISFIYNQAKKLSFNFDNQLIDTIEMAKKKLPGLKNYKLGTVVQKLNIILENAHRAVNDATATAKVFIKLM